MHTHATRAEEVVVWFALAALYGMVRLCLPVLDYGLIEAPMGSLVAFVGCDGSGKSTLTGDLHASLSASLPVRVAYLGLGSGTLGQKIKRMPIVGPRFERKLERKATQARTSGQKIPDLLTALVIYAFSLIRLRRFKRMLRLRRDGFVVLTDRYPQTECPGFYDGPGLSAAAAGSPAVAALARRERQIYAWMAAFRPNVIIRLNVDAATALARKPDHRADLIRRKVSITPKLLFAGAPIVDLDATQPYGSVRTAAANIVQGALAKAGMAVATA